MKKSHLSCAGMPVHACIVTRVLALCIVITVLTLGGSLAQEETQSRDSPDAKTLEGLLSELLRLELEENEEKNAWHEQGGQMETLIALLKAEKERLGKAIEGFEAKKETERTERERLASRIAAMKDVLSRIAISAEEAGRDILEEYEKLPAPLQERLKTGARLVRSRLDERASAENAAERLRTVVAFSHDMQRILSEIHVVKEVIGFGNRQRVEVDVLYLGGVIGFYLDPDRKHAGILKRSQGKWTRESHDDIAPQVALALEVKRKETPPTLVALPLNPPESKENENDE